MDALFDVAQPTRRWPAWLRYALATVLALCSAGLREALHGYIGGNNPFLVFFPAIFASAFLLGRVSGVVCTVASALIAVFLYSEPRGSLELRFFGDALALLLFIAVGLLTTHLIEALHAERMAAKRVEYENAALLEEVTHRIKNKLQFISGLLSLQAGRAPREAQDALNVAVDRIAVVGRITDRLAYRSGQSRINAHKFLDGLCRDLQLALVGARPITLTVDVPPVSMTLEQASLVGLIVNELVTNALKHAFEDREGGRVAVRLVLGDDGLFRLTVADDGKGFNDPRSGTGLRLVSLLVAQLEGERHVEKPNGPGTAIQITFPRKRPASDMTKPAAASREEATARSMRRRA